MKGIQAWTEDWYVGKQSEFKTKEDFIQGLRDEEGLLCDIEDVFEEIVRYYPRGHEYMSGEFEPGQGIYMSGASPGRGSFKVWATANTWEVRGC